jgi:hypothetical protein
MEGRQVATSIPSEEDFSRADKLMEERYHNLEGVEQRFMESFRKRVPLHSVFIFVKDKHHYNAYVFFDKDSDLAKYRKQSIVEEMEECLYMELERVGRGMRDDVTIAVEYDSHEGVVRDYGGDYRDRLA